MPLKLTTCHFQLATPTLPSQSFILTAAAAEEEEECEEGGPLLRPQRHHVLLLNPLDPPQPRRTPDTATSLDLKGSKMHAEGPMVWRGHQRATEECDLI